MARKPPSTFALALTGSLTSLFIVWTLLVHNTQLLIPVDDATLAPRLVPNSPLAQIMSAFALLTWPGLQYAGLLGVAIWAARHRLRNLAIALVSSAALGWGSSALLKLAFRRPRPASDLDVLTAHGWSYPSGHMTAVMVTAIMVVATVAVTRQHKRIRLSWAVGGAVLVLAVAGNRWVMGSHFLSDLVGGTLLGGTVAVWSLIMAGVRVIPAHLMAIRTKRAAAPLPPASAAVVVKQKCAVIYNPTKVTDWPIFRRHVEYELNSRGFDRPLWLETTPDDSGREMIKEAVAKRVDLVLGAGGDGTIRVVTAGLAGTGIPFGLIPAGTGNLLARNLGIPLDERAALEVAFDGVDTAIDLVKITVDGKEPDFFAVMAGIGIDAVIMEGTNPDLKKAVGSAAYFVSAARHANHPALHATIQVDDGPVFKRRAHVLVIGNVGYLQANIPLIPDARADDGLLDLLVASPRTPQDWVKLTTHVLTRRRRRDEQLDRITGSRVVISTEERDPYQLDGDTAGLCSEIIAEVQPGALTLRMPR